MATLTGEESDQMSRLLNKLGVRHEKVYTLEDLRTVISPPEEKRSVKRDNIVTGYIISELEDGKVNRMFVSRSYEESLEKLLEWTEGADKTEYIQAEMEGAHEKMTNSSKEEEEKEEMEEEGEWIAVNHRGKGRHKRRASSGVGGKGDQFPGNKAGFFGGSNSDEFDGESER